MIETPGRPAIRLPSGRDCTMFACDIADSTRPDRDNDIQLFLRRALYDMLRDGFRDSGIGWEHCEHHDRGDGALVIIPPGLDARAIIAPFPDLLTSLIRRHNRIVTEPARIQLRAAVNTGPVYRDDHGIAGQDVTMLCRMLDARKLRRALADSAAETALIISASAYDSLVRPHPGLIDTRNLRPLTTRVKRTKIRGWIYIPGAPPPNSPPATPD